MTEDRAHATAALTTPGYERRYRAAHGDTTEPFSFAFGLKLIAWLGEPDGLAAFKDAYREAREQFDAAAPRVRDSEHSARCPIQRGECPCTCGAGDYLP